MRKSKFTEGEKKAIVERYVLRAELPLIIIREVGI